MSVNTVIDEVVTVTATTTDALKYSGAHNKATFYVEVSAITRTSGSLNVTLNWTTADDTTLAIAEVTGITAAGLYEITKQAPFVAGAKAATPEPTTAVWTKVGDATDISGKIYAMYGG